MSVLPYVFSSAQAAWTEPSYLYLEIKGIVALVHIWLVLMWGYWMRLLPREVVLSVQHLNQQTREVSQDARVEVRGPRRGMCGCGGEGGYSQQPAHEPCSLVAFQELPATAILHSLPYIHPAPLHSCPAAAEGKRWERVWSWPLWTRQAMRAWCCRSCTAHCCSWR